MPFLSAAVRSAPRGDSDAARAVHSFFDVWNQRRDTRPAFIAFGVTARNAPLTPSCAKCRNDSSVQARANETSSLAQ